MPRGPNMSGIFDWLRRLAPPVPSGSMLPAARKEQLPAPIKKETKSIAEVLRSKQKGLTPAPKEVIDVLRSKQSLIEVPKGVREILAPAEKPKERKDVKWEDIVPKGPAREAPLSEEVAQFLKPETVYEANRFARPDEWPFGEPPIWWYSRWQMPSTYEVADFVRQRWDLPGMYDYVLSNVTTPWWKQKVLESAHVGEPAVLDVEQVTDSRNYTWDLPRFLRIPDAVIELYGQEGREGLKRFSGEILQPMIARVEKALEVFRPTPVLRGWFELEPDKDENFWIRYKEARFRQEG